MTRCLLVFVALAILFLPAAASLATEVDAESRAKAAALVRRVASGGAPLTDEELDLVLAASHTDEVDVDLVMLAAVVVDDKGSPVSGLEKTAFAIREDGEPRPLAWFSEDHGRAFRLAIMLDVSGSMNEPMRTAEIRAALLPLLREVRQEDRLRLYSFASREVRSHGDWNNRPMKTLDLALRLPRHGKTALVDALVAAADFLPRAPRERQAIVMITDGMDNASAMTPEQVIAAARTVEIPIYVLGLGGLTREIQSRRGDSPFATLERITEQTGGRFYLIGGEGEAEMSKEAARAIRDDLRHQYWLAFRPQSPPDGAFHPIEVRLPGTSLKVRSRQGYMRRPTPE